MRLRTASIEIDWKTRSIMAGLEKAHLQSARAQLRWRRSASRRSPATGNLWLWLPQVRAEQDFTFGRSSGLRAQVGVLQTRETLPYPGASVPGPLEPARPALEGRFEFFHNLDDDRRLEFASGFHTSTTHVGGISVPSSLFSARLVFQSRGAAWSFRAPSTAGKTWRRSATAMARGSTGIGRIPDSRPEHRRMGPIDLHTVPRVDLHLFTGQQDDENRDLTIGRIGKNLLFGGNVFYRIAPNVLRRPRSHAVADHVYRTGTPHQQPL